MTDAGLVSPEANTPASDVVNSEVLDPQAAAATATPDQPGPGAENLDELDTSTETPEDLEAEDVDGAVEGEASDFIELEDGTQIPVADAVKAYQRVEALRARVTRKEQEIASQRRETEQLAQQAFTQLQQAQAQAQRANQILENYEARLAVLSKKLDSEDEQWSRVDWDRFEQEDPVEAAKAFRRYQQHEKRKQAMAAEQNQLKQRRAEEFSQQIAVARQELNGHIARSYPDLVDPTKGATLRNAMLKTALDLGYTQQEIEQTLDRRGFDMWVKATMWDQHLADQGKRMTPKPKTEPGNKIRVVRNSTRPATAVRAGMVNPAQAKLEAARAQFHKTRSMADGLAFEAAKREARQAGAQ